MVWKKIVGDFRCLLEEMNNENSRFRTPTLPHHLLLEHILPRLPVKSLNRFKFVSKDWLSSISTPQFAKSHLQFSSNSLQNFLIKTGKNDFYLLPYDEHNNLKELVELDTRLLPPIEVSPIGCCNGLVCLYFGVNEDGFFAVWNPATQQYRRIDYPNGKHFPVLYGFGYSSFADDFKIVAAFISDDDFKDDLYVFSLKTGKWRWVCQLQDYSIGKAYQYSEGLFVDDTLYWNFDRLGGKPLWILGFNLVSEEFKEIPMLKSDAECAICRHAIRGCLTVCCEADVWILKQNGDSSYSWEKLFFISERLDALYIAFSVTGMCLIRPLGQMEFVDPNQENPHRTVSSFNFGPPVDGMQYVESLFSPFGEQNPVRKKRKRRTSRKK